MSLNRSNTYFVLALLFSWFVVPAQAQNDPWPLDLDVRKDSAEQYKGWPVTIHQQDNYDRTPIAHLPEIKVDGMTDPVVEVYRQRTGNLVYAYRINGSSVKPEVFKDGLYRVKIGEQPDQMKTLSALEAQEDQKSGNTINVSFQ